MLTIQLLKIVCSAKIFYLEITNCLGQKEIYRKEKTIELFWRKTVKDVLSQFSTSQKLIDKTLNQEKKFALTCGHGKTYHSQKLVKRKRYNCT